MGTLQTFLPNFFIIGAAKAGTTSLYMYLRQHPDIYFPTLKEPHFFDDEETYRRGLEWYTQEFFASAGAFPARGEATPFLHRPHVVCNRIRDSFGASFSSLKFIVMLRDPVERAWSHYLHRRRNYIEQESFEAALAKEDQRLKENPDAWAGYFRDGLYAQQIENWLQVFSKEQFVFLLNEDLKTNPHLVIEKVSAFLNIRSDVNVNVGFQANKAAIPRSKMLMNMLGNPPKVLSRPARMFLSRTTRRKMRVYLRYKNLKPYDKQPELDAHTAASLRKRYIPDIRKLEKIINRDLSAWICDGE